MQALEVLALQPLSAPQVAAALKVHPRTARRLLNRLRDEGYLSRTDDRWRVYTPTLRIVALAGKVVERARVARRALPVAEQLHRETGWDAHLMIPSYRSALCIVHVDGSTAPEPGLRELVPCHCTATGKVLLAYSQAWRDSVLRARLERRTAKTTTDPTRLRAETDEIRERGYALEDGENDPDTRAAAAPVFGPTGDVVAALGLSTRDQAPFDELASLVVPRAAALSDSLVGPHE
jgi:IclR family KDG regulon transcriptional repressor